MEVTKKNFKESLELVSTTINNAAFLAIDGEFTGLSSGKHGIHAFDTPKDRYSKMQKGSMDFLLMQFGLCAFEFDPQQEKYITKAFNFYIFPHPFSRQSPDVRFSCQSSSIDFMIAQGFDFNKVFKDGIPYLTAAEEGKLREALEEKHHQQEAQMSSPTFTSPMGDTLVKGPPAVPEEHKEFIENVCQKIEQLLQSDDTTCELPSCTGYQRKLIYQNVALRYKSSVHLETKTGEKKERFIVVSKTSGEADFIRHERAKRQAEVEELNDAVGFSKVIRMISQSGKLVIGHNMLLDVLHTVNQFHCRVPDDYEEFKALISCIFPRLLDTKLMASTQPFKDMIQNTTLADLQRALEYQPFSKPDIGVADGFPNYCTSSEHLHEAGYDAYLTGMCFLSMLNYLSSFQTPRPKVAKPSSKLVEPFVNKLFLMRVWDIPYMNLAGPDLTPSRDHVFHIMFPADWKTTDLTNLFSPFGAIQIAWLDETSALIAPYRREPIETVLRTLSHGEGYRVVSYQDYLHIKDGVSPPSCVTPITMGMKRKMPTSDVDLPNKKKRSSEMSPRLSTPRQSSSTPRHSIQPIPEVDEDSDSDKMDGDASVNGADSKIHATVTVEEDIGVPLENKLKNSSEKDKLFAEPSDW